MRYAAAAGGPRRRPVFTLLPAERPPGRRESKPGAGALSRRPRLFREPRLVCWGNDANTPNRDGCARYGPLVNAGGVNRTPRLRAKYLAACPVRSSPFCATSPTRSPATPDQRCGPREPSSTSAVCSTEIRCRPSTSPTGSSPRGRPVGPRHRRRSAPDRRGGARARRPSAASRCSASASGRSCSRTRSAAGWRGCRAAMVAWAPIEPLPAAADDPVLGSLPAGAMALHWNEDGFEPPAGAVELLRRPGGSGEGFRYGDRAGASSSIPRSTRRPRGLVPDGLPGAVRGRRHRGAGARGRRARLDGQRALSEALFGGFARVVAGARSLAA